LGDFGAFFKSLVEARCIVFEDRRLEVTSALDVDVDDETRRVALALRQQVA